MKTILVVEDSPAIQEAVKLLVGDKARCLKAATLTEASLLFVRHWGEIDTILVDGSVTVDASTPNNDFTPEEWVKRLRRIGFGGDIIAFSASRSSRTNLIAAGCNKQFAKGEESLERLLEFLDLPDFLIVTP